MREVGDVGIVVTVVFQRAVNGRRLGIARARCTKVRVGDYEVVQARRRLAEADIVAKLHAREEV